MAEATSTCGVCGAQFPYKVGRKYCSRVCKDRRPRNRPPQKPVAYPVRVCLVCGCEFMPRRPDQITACSRKCGYVWLGFRKSILADGGRVSVTVRRNRCVSCGKSFQRQGRYCSDQCQPTYYKPVTHGTCRRCGEVFDRSRDGASRYLCSAQCASEAMREARRKARKAPAAVAARKADKKRRKALERGANGAERVCPDRVFERDGWRCGICGNKTLQSKRGTCHPKAPELDHIVALALGGSHTYANTMCACRACNGTKGAAAFGQLPLFPRG